MGNAEGQKPEIVRILNWSTGKDAAYCLWLLQQRKIRIDVLLTTVSDATDRVSMHGVRNSLLKRQAAAIGLPLHTINIPESCGIETYNSLMLSALKQYEEYAVKMAVFGDIFLDDLRHYREQQLAKVSFSAEFPLWKAETGKLARDMIHAGFKAVVVCVNKAKLDESFCGREFNESFIDDLPAGVDPCGENGEFHTFVYDGPVFGHAVRIRKGKTVLHSYKQSEADNEYDTDFYYCDLLPY
jgi:uncharacterized protein (TIGR00290 family)